MGSETDALARFIAGLLGGSIDIGVTLVPLLGAYKRAKHDPEWREKGFAEWLQSDPQAAELLTRVLNRVREVLPRERREALIIALGGAPLD